MRNFLDLGAVNEPWHEELEAAALRVVRSGRYIGGEEVEAFERELAEITGTKYAVGVSNGLDALRLTLRAWIEMGRLRPGDEVAVAANTYIASVLAIVDAGLKPLLVEPDQHTYNLSGDGLAMALTPKTKAVMPVHLYGRAAWDEKMANLVRESGLLVIEDNAQAIGATAPAKGVNGESKNTGALGHAAAFSFYPTKNIGALGDAGAVTTEDEELAATVRALSNYGSDRRYHNIYAGYNCRLDPIQAAMLRVKLPHLKAITAQRCRNAETYWRELHNNGHCIPPELYKGNVWHMFALNCLGHRDAMQQHLTARGIPTDINYPVPPHLQPCFKGRLEHGPLPVTERLANNLLCLPVDQTLGEEDIKLIANAVNTFKP